jgi:cytidylate kinase
MLKDPSPRDARRLVDDEVLKWAQKQRKGAGEQAAEPWPLITVSREFGALGTDIGRRAAEKLGFSFWDQEIVHTIADQTGIRETLLASLDEQARSGIEDFIAESVFGAKTTVAKYVHQVVRVVRTLERHGGAVVIGRGAQFILAPEAALRVRVVCPRQKRVADYAKREGLSEDEAERQVDSVDRERRGFIRRHYDRDAGDPVHYDIMISTECLSPEQAAGMVVAAYGSKFGRLPESAG